MGKVRVSTWRPFPRGSTGASHCEGRLTCDLAVRLASFSCLRRRCCLGSVGGEPDSIPSAPAAECRRMCIGGELRCSPPGCRIPRSPNVVGVESRRRCCVMDTERPDGSCPTLTAVKGRVYPKTLHQIHKD